MADRIQTMNTKIFFLGVTYSFLVACGGGGGSDSNSSATPERVAPSESVGVFLDSPVKGLRYQTKSHSGLTNSAGEFRYIEGDNVTFFLGDTLLGMAQGGAVVTPFSLFDIVPITRESEISAALSSSDINNYDRAMNVASLLQTLDQDSNPANGIDLGSAHEKLLGKTIKLSVKAREFVDEPSLEVAKRMVGINSRLAFSRVASHLYESLDLSIKSDLVNQVTSSFGSTQPVSTSLEYDNNGNITSQTIDTDEDGIADSMVTFGYDEAGNLTSKSNTATNISETLAYDENNNLISHLSDNFRRLDLQQTYSFNDNNTLSQIELDLGADGDVEATTSYLYDTDGNLITYELDHGRDGSANILANYVFDNDVVSSFEEDSNNNGEPDLSISYGYDSKGNRTTQNISATADGVPSNNGTYKYDDNGNVTRYEQDNDLDGRADYIESSSYDENGNRTAYRRDLNADGTWDSITQYSYDDDNNRTSMNEDSDGDGVIDKQWSINYDTTTLDNAWNSILGKLDSPG